MKKNSIKFKISLIYGWAKIMLSAHFIGKHSKIFLSTPSKIASELIIKFHTRSFLMNFFALFFTIFLAPSFSSLAFDLTQSGASTNDIIREVEKTLLFSDDEKSKMELMQNQLNQKSDFTIIAGNKKDDATNNAIELKVNETRRTINIDARTKEKMAYNATLNGQYEVAVELYKQVVTDEPNNNYALFSLATIYQKIGQLRQAKAIYYQLLQNHPENKEEIISNILSTLAEESPRDALYLLTRLSASHPQSPYILVQTALAYSGVKNYDKASDLLRRAIALDPERIDYKYNLAINYDKAGDYEKAFAVYQEVIRSYSDNKWSAAIPLQAIQLRLETIKNKF